MMAKPEVETAFFEELAELIARALELSVRGASPELLGDIIAALSEQLGKVIALTCAGGDADRMQRMMCKVVDAIAESAGDAAKLIAMLQGGRGDA